MATRSPRNASSDAAAAVSSSLLCFSPSLALPCPCRVAKVSKCESGLVGCGYVQLAWSLAAAKSRARSLRAYERRRHKSHNLRVTFSKEIDLTACCCAHAPYWSAVLASTCHQQQSDHRVTVFPTHSLTRLLQDLGRCPSPQSNRERAPIHPKQPRRAPLEQEGVRIASPLLSSGPGVVDVIGGSGKLQRVKTHAAALHERIARRNNHPFLHVHVGRAFAAAPLLTLSHSLTCA